MQLSEKQELVRLLNLYQADLLDQNWENIESGQALDWSSEMEDEENEHST